MTRPPVCAGCMVQMELVGGINLAFEQSSGRVPAYKYICPKCGHPVAVVIKNEGDVVGITETALLRLSLRMVSSSFKDAELEIPEGSELHDRVYQELLRLMREASMRFYQQDWYPGIEISLYEEIFDLSYGKNTKRVTDYQLTRKIKILAESLGGWCINPHNWKNVDFKHPGFVTIIQWSQMYENRYTWFTKQP